MIWLKRRWAGASGSVAAITIPKAAPLAFELYHLWPLTTQCPPSRTAVVRSEVGSAPLTSGSVMPKNDRTSARCSGQKNRSFWAAVPKCQRISALPLSGALEPKTRGA